MTSAPAVLASIPSPSEGVWHLGPLPLRGYALSILVGIAVAVWLGERRWQARGGERGLVSDVALWAVPFGIVGGRLYHVLTSWSDYFGDGGDPLRALEVWRGGLGIWGAVALGGVGAWVGARRHGVPLPALGDAVAPGVVLAQACGRWGNWFNQELFGGPTDLPWGLEIAPENRPSGYAASETFHPTFLYESLWCVLVAVVLVVADRRFRMGHGRVFALYVVLYSAGRGVIETMRVDPSAELFGARWNVWVAAAAVVGGLVYLVLSARARPGREDPASLRGRRGAVDGVDGAAAWPDGATGAGAGASTEQDETAEGRARETR